MRITDTLRITTPDGTGAAGITFNVSGWLWFKVAAFRTRVTVNGLSNEFVVISIGKTANDKYASCSHSTAIAAGSTRNMTFAPGMHNADNGDEEQVASLPDIPLQGDGVVKIETIQAAADTTLSEISLLLVGELKRPSPPPRPPIP